MKAVFSRLALVLLTLTMIGCGPRLRPDPAPVPVDDAGYNSVEFTLKGKRFNGIATVQVDKGTKLSDLGLTIEGYFQGHVRVSSSSCGVDKSIEFVKTSAVAVPMSGVITDDCVFAITETLELPNQQNQSIEVSPITGVFLVKVRPPEVLVTSAQKISGNFQVSLVPNVSFSGTVEVHATGCGITYTRLLQAVANRIILPLQDMATTRERGECLIEGIIISQDIKNVKFAILMSFYSPRFNQLSTPLVEFNGTKMVVTAESGVTVIDLDGVDVFNSKATFDKFDPKVPHVMRLLTVKGRNNIGEWSVADKQWTWKP